MPSWKDVSYVVQKKFERGKPTTYLERPQLKRGAYKVEENVIAQVVALESKHCANIDIHLAYDPEHPFPRLCLDRIELPRRSAVQPHAKCRSQGDTNVCVAL